MRRICFFLIFAVIFESLSYSAIPIHSEIKEIRNEIQKLHEKEIIVDVRDSVIESTVKQMKDMQDLSNSSVSKSLDASNRMIGIFAIIVAIGVTFLGCYINWIQRRVKSLLTKVEDKENSVRSISNDLQSDFDSVYKRVRRADTISLLERLIVVPQDISNVGEALMARELIIDDYEQLKQAYYSLLSYGDKEFVINSAGLKAGHAYGILFIQNFLVSSLFDPDPQIRDLVSSIIYSWAERSAFPNDMEKVAKELAPLLKDKTRINNVMVPFKLFLRGVYNSRYKRNTNVLNSLRSAIGNDDIWTSVIKEINNSR